MELKEDDTDDILTYHLVIKRKKVLPTCCVCGQQGNIFMFVDKDNAYVFCNPLCEIEYKNTPGVKPEKNEILVNDDGDKWLNLLVATYLVVLLVGFAWFAL